MPRVYTQKAAKDYPDHGIKKGQTYYRWSFRYGGERLSSVYPKPSQLTQSAFLSPLYATQESFEGVDPSDPEAIQSAVDNAVGEINELRDNAQDAFDNMPEGLQQGPTGELLENRANECDDLISELEGIDVEGPFAEVDDWKEEALADLADPMILVPSSIEEVEAEEADKRREAGQEILDEIAAFNWAIE